MSRQKQKSKENVYRAAWNTLAYLNFLVMGVLAWRLGFWPLSVLCWIPLAYFSHALLMSFHEASHGNLGPGRLANEVRGTILGWFSFVPLSAYRAVHFSHHAHLAEKQDAEMWPYGDVATPRWFRVTIAWAELSCGLLVTPILFLRGVLVNENLSSRQKRRIAADYALLIGFWAAVLTTMGLVGLWAEFVMVFLVPAFLAGILQSLRKFTEHLGLRGNTPETAARTIDDTSPVGRFLSATMLNVTYHTAHHRDASLPYQELPSATAAAVAADPESNPIYSSYWRAFLDMVPALIDPKVGGQWERGRPEEKSAPAPAPARQEARFLRGSISHQPTHSLT